MMVGLFEPVCAPWRVEGIPEDFSFGDLAPDWERMGPYVETARGPPATPRPRPGKSGGAVSHGMLAVRD
jgi:hypothetical protein